MQTEITHTPKENDSSEGAKPSGSNSSKEGSKERSSGLDLSLQCHELGSSTEGPVNDYSGHNLGVAEHLETDGDDKNLETDGNRKRLQAQDPVDGKCSNDGSQLKFKSANPFSPHLPVSNDHMLNLQEADAISEESCFQLSCRSRAVPFSAPHECATYLPPNEVKPERVQSRLHDPAWTLLPNCYMENNGYRLGIRSCRHFEGADGIVVEVQNGQNFVVVLGNLNRKRCNVDILVDGKLVAEIQLRDMQIEFLVQGPILTIDDSGKKFVFLRSRDAPAEAAIDVHCPDNGVVEARFMPEKEPEQELGRVRVVQREGVETGEERVERAKNVPRENVGLGSVEVERGEAERADGNETGGETERTEDKGAVGGVESVEVERGEAERADGNETGGETERTEDKGAVGGVESVEVETGGAERADGNETGGETERTEDKGAVGGVESVEVERGETEKAEGKEAERGEAEIAGRRKGWRRLKKFKFKKWLANVKRKRSRADEQTESTSHIYDELYQNNVVELTGDFALNSSSIGSGDLALKSSSIGSGDLVLKSRSSCFRGIFSKISSRPPNRSDAYLDVPTYCSAVAFEIGSLPRTHSWGSEYGSFPTSPELWCGGAVALQESSERRLYDLADRIEIDENKTVVLRLRMVARSDDRSKPNPVAAITPLYQSIVPPPRPI